MNPIAFVRLSYCAAALALGLVASVAHGESLQIAKQQPFIAVPYAERLPAMTAELSDEAWQAAAIIPRLASSKGADPALVPQITEVRLLWCEEFLFVRFTCEAREIVATLSGRDAEYHREDAVEVFLDPAGDGKAYVELQVSPNNGVRDVLYLCTGKPEYDEDGRILPEILKRDCWSFDSWDFDGLKTAARRFARAGGEGWITDIAIPASILHRLGEARFSPMDLRANFIRLEHPHGKHGERHFLSSDWAPVLQGNPHRSPGAYGTLSLQGPPER